MRVHFIALLLLASCATAPATAPGAQLPPNNSPIQMNRNAPDSRGPVRNLAAQKGEEIVTIRYWKIRKGTFPQFLEASQTGIWPFFEKIGARIVGLLVGGFDVSAGSLSVFKTGADGKVLWAQLLAVSAGAGNHALARAVAVDADGGVVVAGELAGHLDFAGETLKSAAGSRDILVAKLDKTGKQLWAKIFGDGQTQAALGVAVDGARNIYLTGMVSGNVNFGGADLKGAVNDLFLVKLDESGAHQWSKVCGDSVSRSRKTIRTAHSAVIFDERITLPQ